jgi:hypothetical protein
MTRRFAYRFILIMFAWLAHRWPYNPFLFFANLASLLIDVAFLWALSSSLRLHIVVSYAAKLDFLRFTGVLPPPPPWADHALKQVVGLKS